MISICFLFFFHSPQAARKQKKNPQKNSFPCFKMEELYLPPAHAGCALNVVAASACWAKTLPSLSRYYLTPPLLLRPPPVSARKNSPRPTLWDAPGARQPADSAPPGGFRYELVTADRCERSGGTLIFIDWRPPEEA